MDSFTGYLRTSYKLDAPYSNNLVTIFNFPKHNWIFMQQIRFGMKIVPGVHVPDSSFGKTSFTLCSLSFSSQIVSILRRNPKARVPLILYKTYCSFLLKRTNESYNFSTFHCFSHPHGISFVENEHRLQSYLRFIFHGICFITYERLQKLTKLTILYWFYT